MIRFAIHRGYVGVGLLNPNEVRGIEDTSILVFIKLGEAPGINNLTMSLNVNSDINTLNEVIVNYSPESAQIFKEGAINSVAKDNIGNVDPIASKDEHQDFLETLRNLGISVIFSTAQGSKGHSAIFTRDPAFTIGDKIVVGKLGNESRRYETEKIAAIPTASDVINVSEDSEAILEGGDVIHLGENLTIVGIGERTNKAGFEKLIALFPGRRFIGVEHPELHLDVLFTVVGRKKVLADPTQLPEDFINFISKNGYQIVIADPVEQHSLGCNVLTVEDNKVVAAAENKKTNAALRAAGVNVIEVSMPNLIKKGGGPRCMTCPTNRENN